MRYPSLAYRVGAIPVVVLLCAILVQDVAASDKTVDTQSPNTVINSVGMMFQLIPAGSFVMGSSVSAEETVERYNRMDGRKEDYQNEHPAHQVSLTRPFYMQTTEVTQGQWQKVMGDNPSFFKDCGEDCPVEQVSWNDTWEFIRKLNRLEGTHQYRLPTEAEWEYACRAGSTDRFFFGDDMGAWNNMITEYGWYATNSKSDRRSQTTHPVGKKLPNSWNIYDMYGNVLEWCQDWHGEYNDQPAIDPSGPSSGEFRVIRGGSCFTQAFHIGSPARYGSEPDSRKKGIGFRVVRD